MAEAPVRVLLVEDDEDDYLLTRKLLDQVGGPAVVLERVGTYEDGLAALRDGRHDVCLLDHQLDGRTGLELLREAAAAGCRTPIILLTGQGDRETDVEAMRAGAADYLVKGRIDPPLLERSIRYAIDRSRARDELKAARDELEARVGERTRELAEAVARLAEEHRCKDDFLAMLAHELRNPLAPVMNGLHLLRLADADKDARERTRDMMERQVRHLARLVDELLDVSRIGRGKVVLRRERLDLVRLVRTAAEDRRPALEQAGLWLAVEAPDTPVWVAGDATRLAQVLGNLLDNAAKFTDHGGRVTVCLARPPGGGGPACLTIRDTGIGIDPRLLPRLFDPFVQADRSLDRGRGGLGLGLAVVKGLVELHGGTVRAASAGPGRGAEFTVCLPAEDEPAALAGATAPSAPGGTKHLRVLVVEDNRDAADSLRLLLECFGYEVTVAYTGPDGLDAARRAHPDVVVCDIGLPGMDGFQVAGALRRDPETATARLIAVTGYGGEEDRRRALAAGFSGHLTKPADPEALLRMIDPAGGG